jgi:hypothetical protein
LISATANITGGNILFGAGIVSGTGNITGGNVLGGANVNATTHTGTTVSVTANITGGNILFGAGIVSGTGNITGGNLTIAGNTATITTANISIGYLNIPQISFAANATAALVDSGKHYYTTSASNLALTLADNSAVSWPVGTALSVIERKGGWYRVRAQSGQEGWVKLLSVRLTARSADPGTAGSGDAAGAALSGAESGGAGGAAAGAIGSMVTGSAADSTAVRGGSSGKLSGKQLVDPAKAGASGSLEQVETFKPSDADMDDFEKGLDAPAKEAPKP